MKDDKTSQETETPCKNAAEQASGLWDDLIKEAKAIHEHEPQMRIMLQDVFLTRENLAGAIAARLSRKLSREDMKRKELLPFLDEILNENEQLVNRMAHDMQAIYERDPACTSPMQPLLYYKGFMAISCYRISNHLWHTGRRDLALYFQSLASEVFGVDIHPAATIGCGILMDHATSVVVGETAIIEDNVSILHEVTLGGTGKATGARHPIVRSGVLIGAGAKILGRVEIGKNAKVGAGSVVLEDVPPHKTVAGVPAVIVGESSDENPAAAMDQSLRCSEL